MYKYSWFMNDQNHSAFHLLSNSTSLIMVRLWNTMYFQKHINVHQSLSSIHLLLQKLLWNYLRINIKVLMISYDTDENKLVFSVNKLSAPSDNDLDAPKNLGGRRGSCVNLTMLNDAATNLKSAAATASSNVSSVTSTKSKPDTSTEST